MSLRNRLKKAIKQYKRDFHSQEDLISDLSEGISRGTFFKLKENERYEIKMHPSTKRSLSKALQLFGF